MRYGWISDIHLNFLGCAARRRFFDDLDAHEVDGWLLSGDTGEAPSILSYLREFDRRLAVPTCFVLGNHDFYNGSLKGVVHQVAELSAASERLVWLTTAAPLFLNKDLAIVGDDCWSDGRLGDPMGTPVELNDFYLIRELTGLARPELVERLNGLGDASVRRLTPKLEVAARTCANVILVTHPPPFEGATWHEGSTSSPDWLPWFSCKAAGDALLEVADGHPDTRFLVLCGHTHSRGVYSPCPNVVVHTAAAEYGRPVVEGVVEAVDGRLSIG